MILHENGQISAAALPVAALKDHLRLGTGFGTDGLQDGLLESCLRTAVAVIERRTGKALIARNFTLDLPYWRDPMVQSLPLAPISAVTRLRMVQADGGGDDVPVGRYRLVADLHRPKLQAVGLSFPAIPEGGQAKIDFRAGFGDGWADLPPDLAQACMLLAAQYYEHRHDHEGDHMGMPKTVQGLIAPWRIVRMLGGKM